MGNRLLGLALKGKADELDTQARALDEHIEDLEARLVPYRDAEREWEEFEAQLEQVRRLAHDGGMPGEQKRNIVEMLRVKVLTAKDHVYLEVPRAAHVNADTASRSRASEPRCWNA